MYATKYILMGAKITVSTVEGLDMCLHIDYAQIKIKIMQTWQNRPTEYRLLTFIDLCYIAFFFISLFKMRHVIFLIKRIYIVSV